MYGVSGILSTKAAVDRYFEALLDVDNIHSD